MKIIKGLLRGFLFIAGAALAAYLFMPWRQIGEAALLTAAGEPGAPALSWSAVGGAPGGFVVENFEVRKLAGIADISCKTLTVVPNIAASFLNMAPTCQITFTGNVLAEIPVTPLKKIPGIVIGDGRFTAVIGARELLLEDLRSNGDLSARGTLLLASGPVIRRAEMTLNVKSEPFEKELSSLQAALGLPLQQEAPGRWVLRRSAVKAP